MYRLYHKYLPLAYYPRYNNTKYAHPYAKYMPNYL